MAKHKRALVLIGIIVAVLVAILVVTPFFINADTFRPEIEQELGAILHRKVEIGHLRVSLLSGSLVANSISIGDDPAYSREPFLTAKSLSVGVALWPLIRSRQLNVHSFTFDSPQVQLLRTPKGDWNFDTIGGSGSGAAPSADAGNPALASFTVARMAISNGTIAFGRAGQPTRLAYEKVNITASNISGTRAFPLTFDARTPGGGKLNLKANVGPIEDVEAARLPFQGKLAVDGVPAEDVQNLLAVLGYALPAGSALQGGTIKADMTLHGPFQRFVTSGPVQLSNVRLAGFSLAGELARALGTASAANGNDTLIQVASSDLRYAADGLRADNLNIVVPALGTLTGSGTVGANNSLNFRMVAKLAGNSGLAQLVNLPLLNQKTSGGLPFHIEGTTEHPKVVPDIQGVAGIIEKLAQPQGNQQQQQQPGGVIGGILNNLLNKKKTQQKQQP
ncbi:MAG: AsmA family protein [Acidobacteriota bacterium]|nr:AsmA family protein [Acidobacteriota bacterium]